MTIKNTKKNISAEPEFVVTDVETEEKNQDSNSQQNKNNFQKDIGIKIIAECFYDEEDYKRKVLKEIIIPISELVRLEYLKDKYYDKAHIDSNYYTKTHIDTNFYNKPEITTILDGYYTKVWIDDHFYDKDGTEDIIDEKIEEAIVIDEVLDENSLHPVQNKTICEQFLTEEEVRYLIDNIEVGHGKLVSFYLDCETGDLVVQNDGFEYYTTEEVDNLFTIGVEEVTPSANNILKSYMVTQGLNEHKKNIKKIDILKDFLLKKVELKLATSNITENSVVKVPAGHQYFDFTFNTKDSDSNDNLTHLYLDVNALVDVYRADEQTLTLNNQKEFSIKDVPSELISNINGLATRLNLDGKVDKEQGKGLSQENFTSEEKTKLANIEEEANKITIDNSLNRNSQNPVANSIIYQALMNMSSEYIYLDGLGNLHALDYRPSEINLSFTERGELEKEVIGTTMFGDGILLEDAYVDIYDVSTNEYILTLTNDKEFFEELTNYEAIYGKIRNILSGNIAIDIPLEPILIISGVDGTENIMRGSDAVIVVNLSYANSDSSITLKSGSVVLTDSLELGESYTIDSEVITQLRTQNGTLSLTAILNNDENLPNLSVTKEFEVLS